jgi:phosphate transport system protein
MEVPTNFDIEFGLLHDRVLFLGAEVEQALDRATLAFVNHDNEMADSVLYHDDAIDQIELYIDRQCARVLELSHPGNPELRLVLCLVKIAPLLERIADRACEIARIVIAVKEQPPYPIVSEIGAMSSHALLMLRTGLYAVSSNDPIAARRVVESIDKFNQLYNHTLYGLFAMIVSQPTLATFHKNQLLVAQHLARIGSYVTDMWALTIL